MKRSLDRLAEQELYVAGVAGKLAPAFVGCLVMRLAAPGLP
ncbi:MAG: hypothetical protein VB858_18005 [Planctomycetaceae bacterium]